jgi:DNA-binding LacI/PurR family transcriptional regulator
MMERAERAGEKIAALDRLPDAIFVVSDVSSMGVIRGLRQRGIRVPEDIAIVSHDGIQLGAYSNPSLTTTAVPWYSMATHCVEMVQALHSGKPKEEILALSKTLQASLVVRESCGQRIPNPSAEKAIRMKARVDKRGL